MEKFFRTTLKKNGTLLMFWENLMENADRMSKRKWHTLLVMYDASHYITLFSFGSYGSIPIVKSFQIQLWVKTLITIPSNYQIIQRKYKEISNHTKNSKTFKENKRLGTYFKNFNISIGCL